jgi:hypothetical protein
VTCCIKAFSVSKNTAAVDMILLNFKVMWSVGLINWSVVLWRARKPNWLKQALFFWLTCSADCQDNSFARTPRKTQSLFVEDACLQLRCLALDVLLFRAFAWCGPHRKHSFPYIVTFLRGVFTGHRIETVFLLLLPVFVAVRMLTDILRRNGPRDMMYPQVGAVLVVSTEYWRALSSGI